MLFYAVFFSSLKISDLGSDSPVACAEHVVVAVCSRFLFDMNPFRISAALLVIQPKDCHDFPLYLRITCYLYMPSYLTFQIFGLLNSIVDPDLILFYD
jgi:hypothetical protein